MVMSVNIASERTSFASSCACSALSRSCGCRSHVCDVGQPRDGPVSGPVVDIGNMFVNKHIYKLDTYHTQSTGEMVLSQKLRY